MEYVTYELPDGFGEASLRLLDRAVGLCMVSGQSAATVRNRVLIRSDYISREFGPGIANAPPPDPMAAINLIGEVTKIGGIMARYLAPDLCGS